MRSSCVADTLKDKQCMHRSGAAPGPTKHDMQSHRLTAPSYAAPWHYATAAASLRNPPQQPAAHTYSTNAPASASHNPARAHTGPPCKDRPWLTLLARYTPTTYRRITLREVCNKRRHMVQGHRRLTANTTASKPPVLYACTTPAPISCCRSCATIIIAVCKRALRPASSAYTYPF